MDLFILAVWAAVAYIRAVERDGAPRHHHYTFEVWQGGPNAHVWVDIIVPFATGFFLTEQGLVELI